MFPRIIVDNRPKNGKAKKTPTIVFLAGFPDDQFSAWDKILPQELSKQYRLAFLCLPGFENDGKVPKWGYGINELLDMMHATMEEICGNEKFVLVAHDWGSFFATQYENRHPERLEKLVLLDIGLMTIKSASMKQLIGIAIYQLWFAIAFFAYTAIHVQLGYLIYLSFVYFPLLHLDQSTSAKRDLGKIIPENANSVRKCYPYFSLWCSILTNSIKDARFPSCPTLYLYGLKKPFMFHDDRFLRNLESHNGCKAVPIKTSHWIGLWEPQITLQEIEAFVAPDKH